MSASVDQKFETFVEENLSERQVTDGAGKADGMEKVSVPAPQDASIEDLGGPTNQNYKQDDNSCLLYTSPSPRDATLSRMPSSA